MAQQTVRINVWSGPRNVSTALMYSFRQRADTRVVDEPLYAHYLSTIPDRSEHPGTADVLSTMSSDARVVTDQIILGPCDRPVLFFKQMAHHLVDGVPDDVLRRCVNVLLIRNPREVLTTIVKQFPNPVMRDIGIVRQLELVGELTATGQHAAIIDARLLLESPERVLRQLCGRVGISWDPAMLSWPAGPKPEDGSWAPHWYQNAHASTGFGTYRAKTEPLPAHVAELAAQADVAYRALLVDALR
jgi:Sulfotransferase domain